ncbi:MAG: ABC transporter ATP-binding protein [Alphaproteobacteria bacterium]|nr:MAG: ABC transporter ATP-binding protein [Alphaproteobacteria bacterium]
MLRAEQLAFGHRGRMIGRDVSFEVPAGTVLALLGPNGSGKTTLLKTVLGLLPALGGRVLVTDRPLTHFRPAERARRLAYVPQSAATAFAFTALTIVLMGRTAHAGPFSRPSTGDHTLAHQTLDRLGIAHLADRAITTLSGGERQLVMLARALVQQPKAIILDEPTASLDFGNQGQVMRQIRQLAQDGLAVLFTTHDPNQALAVADHVLLLRDGQSLAQGTPASTLTTARLEALYRSPVRLLSTPDGATAFLPG